MPGADAVCTNLCSLIYELQEYVLPLLTDDSGVVMSTSNVRPSSSALRRSPMVFSYSVVLLRAAPVVQQGCGHPLPHFPRESAARGRGRSMDDLLQYDDSPTRPLTQACSVRNSPSRTKARPIKRDSASSRQDGASGRKLLRVRRALYGPDRRGTVPWSTSPRISTFQYVSEAGGHLPDE